MCINSLKNFLRFEWENDKKVYRCLKRVMDSNFWNMGQAFRQAYQWMEKEQINENLLIKKQWGILRRIMDSNIKLLSMGYNKLIENNKEKKGHLDRKMKYIISMLSSNQRWQLLMAYNDMKQKAQI